MIIELSKKLIYLPTLGVNIHQSAFFDIYKMKLMHHSFISVLWGEEVSEVAGKNFFCDKCGRGYRWATGLSQHKRVECGKEALFQCTLCQYKAKQKVNLMSHIKRKHGDVNFKNLH